MLSATRSLFETAALAAVLAGCSGQQATHGGGQVGAMLPDMPLHGLDGQSRRLAELRGSPLLINVWASWCGPCRAEMAALDNLSQTGRVRVIGVSTDDDPNLAREFLLRAGVSFANFHDADRNLERQFDAAAIPLTLVVDAQGRIVQRVIGARRWDSEPALASIEASLGRR